MISFNHAFAQVIQAGITGGAQFFGVRNDDSDYRRQVKVNPILGYSAGAVLAFKVKDRYTLQTEFLFSTKGKVVQGKVDKELKDRVIYNYFDVPVLYNIFFTKHLKNVREFKWYFGAGPVFSYWLGGRGSIYSSEFSENQFPTLNYKIVFGERGEDISEIDKIYLNNVKRFQLGLNLGGGIMLEPSSNSSHKIMIDLRLEFGHTWLGKATSSDYVIPVAYEDNLKARNMGLRLSVMYLLEANLSKKARHEGKSTIRQK